MKKDDNQTGMLESGTLITIFETRKNLAGESITMILFFTIWV